MRIKIISAVALLTVILLIGCLKDDITSQPAISLENNALLLNYLETNGNYISSDEMPSIINVDELYNNLNNYLIVDVRSASDYTLGHIPGAVNIQNDSLIKFLNSKNALQFPKVIIVSSDGQASAYFTSLLRIYGLNNVYSLNFGMALWNRAFSDIWINNIKDHEIINHLSGSKLYPENPQMNLPDIKIDLQNLNMQNGIKKLIADMIKEGFNSSAYVTLSPPDTMGFNLENGSPIINFHFSGEDISDFYIICTGSLILYTAPYLPPPYPTGHFPDAYFYFYNDFKSSTNIQTIPPDKKIAVYSVSGQESAFITAYLRVLGYDAKSLLYGANNYTYSRLINPNQLYLFTPYVFLAQDIRDYPYMSGSSPK